MSSCCCWEQDLHLCWVSEAVNIKSKVTSCGVTQIQNQVTRVGPCLSHDFHTVTDKLPSSSPKLSRRACVLQTIEELLELHESSVLAVNMWKISSIYEENLISSIGVRRVCGCVTGNLDGESRFLPKRMTNIKVAPGKIRKKPQINIF